MSLGKVPIPFLMQYKGSNPSFLEFHLTFLQVHGKSKMRKAFCEYSNTEFCPPIVVASALSFGFDGLPDGEIVVPKMAAM